MIHYFFLSTSIPDLEIGAPLDISFQELMELFELNVKKSDLAKVKKIRLLIDLKNVREFLIEGTFDPRGNLSLKEIEDALLNRKNLPEYLFDFLDETEDKRDQFQRFSRVFAQFFSHEIEASKGFLKYFFTFERELRLILLAHRARKLKRDILVELKYEDQTDPFVAFLVAAKDMPQLEFPFEYGDLQEVLIKVEENPSKQFQELMLYKIKKIQEKAIDYPFSIDWLLAYMVTLTYLEDWLALDKSQGNATLNKIVKEVA